MLAWFRRIFKKDPPRTAVGLGDMGMEEVGRILRAYREELRVEAEMCVYMYEVGLEEQNYVEQVGDYEIWVQ